MALSINWSAAVSLYFGMREPAWAGEVTYLPSITIVGQELIC